MCDPTGGIATLGAMAMSAAAAAPVATGLAVASGVVGAAGAIHQGNAANAAANYNATILDQNRKTALENAARMGDAAQRDEAALRRKNAQFAGSQIAKAAAAGVDLSSGSMQDAIRETTTLNEADALTLRENWQDRVRGGYADAKSLEMQAQLTRAEGKAARTAGYINATSSLLGAASTVSSKWSAFKKPGAAGASVFTPSYRGMGPSGG